MTNVHVRSHRLASLVVLLLTISVLGASLGHAEEYEFVAKWGSYGSGDGQFRYPGIPAVDAAGNVYVPDWYGHRIQKFTSDGAFLLKWGSYGSGDGQFAYPGSVAVDAAGNVYVTDAYNHRVQRFTSGGSFLTKWGSLGNGDGQFVTPCDVAVDAAGNVYVTDGYNMNVQKFTSDGSFLTKWGSAGSGDGQFVTAYGVAVDAAGNVYVADRGNHRVQKFTSDGSFLLKRGSYGSGDGQFMYANGVAADAAGNVYVADQNNRRIQKFTGSGSFLTKWGSYGSGDGQFNYPEGLDIDATGNVYVSDWYNNRIQKFRPKNTAPIAPIAHAGADQTVEAGSTAGAEVTLDGSGSSDPDGGPLTYQWTWSDAEGDHSATGVSPTIVLPLGDTTVTLRVNDGLVTSAPDAVAITVEDTTAPQISALEVTPDVLWPANNKLREVTVSPTVSDAADANPQVEITSVACNEASFSAADYAITDDPTHLKLRAKREGSNKVGRIYTITLTATDNAENVTESQCTVLVPHDMRGGSGLITTATAVPTAGGAQIVFGLTASADVTVRILNLAGRSVRMLCTDRPSEAGSNTILWNAASDQGLRVPGGTYLIEVSVAGANGTRTRALTQVRVDR